MSTTIMPYSSSSSVSSVILSANCQSVVDSLSDKKIGHGHNENVENSFASGNYFCAPGNYLSSDRAVVSENTGSHGVDSIQNLIMRSVPLLDYSAGACFPRQYFSLITEFLESARKASLLRGVNDDVAASWKEFNELDECAKEEDKKTPSDSTKHTAQKMLTTLCSEFPVYYAVYPDKHEGIVIQTSRRKGHSVLIICEKNSRISCYLSREHKNSRAHFDNHDILEGLPGFILEALK